METLSTSDALGTAAINLTGNQLANTIPGNAGPTASTATRLWTPAKALRFVTAFASPTASQAAGQVRLVDTGTDVNVEVDINGDNTADMLIRVMDVASLSQSDLSL